MRKWQPASRAANNNTGAAAFRVFGLGLTPSHLYKAGLAAFTTALLFMALLTRVLPQRAPVREGEAAPRTIRAPRGATYVDSEATQKQRKDTADAVPPVYATQPRADPNADVLARDIVKTLFDAVRRARRDARLRTRYDKIAQVKGDVSITVSDGSISVLVRCSEEVLSQLEEWALSTTQSHMAQGIQREEIGKHQRLIAAELEASALSSWYRPAVIEIAQNALRPNRIRDIDQEKTDAARRAAADAVSPVERTIAPGDVVIVEGQIATRQHLDQLEALGLVRPRVNYGQGVAVAILVMCLVALFGLYLRERAPAVYNNRGQLAFIAACVIVPVSVAQFSVRLGVFPAVAMSAASFSAMVISALFGVHIAVVGSALIGMLCGLAASGSDPRIIVATTAAGTIGAFAVSFVARRAQMAAGAALIAAGTNTIVLLATNAAFALPMEWDRCLFTFLGGIVAGVGAVSAVLIFDLPLGLTTPMRLAELANPNSPMLRRMMQEAPGTYMSSMMLASWCETCAAAIGADPLLARVGTYYHDIGKLEKPFYFIENQFGERNPHDFLEPALSARVIARHTKDGYRLARQLRLPQKVCDVTRMHHGTSLIRYFYHKAKERSGDDHVDENQFRHVGVKPRFKEAAILMIADTVEAAARTLEDPSPSAVEALVDRLTKEKMDDGQLDESDLTLNDVRIIKGVLVRTLNSMFHQRIPYPEDEEVRT